MKAVIAANAPLPLTPMDLPIDIWFFVLGHIEQLPRRDVAAMARCSRFFNHQLRPRLFQTITLTTVDALQAWERVALEEHKPQRRTLATLLLRRKERHAVRLEDWVPVLHLVRNLGVSTRSMAGFRRNLTARISTARTILGSCPNIDTVYFDFSLDSVIGLLLDNPNVTRLFFAGDNVLEAPILTERREGFQNLTHLWIHDLRYFWSAVAHDGSTVAPEVFPALTHIVAGSELDTLGCEDQIARAVREILRFSSLQRFLFLFPVEEGQEIQIETMPLWPLLVELRDPRVCLMTATYPRGSLWRVYMPIWRWNALTDIRADAVTWESGVPVWDGARAAVKIPRAPNF